VLASAPVFAREATSDPSGPGAARDAARSLPRQFTVEVGPGGSLVADGTRLGAVSEVERWAQRAAQASRFSGAVVFGDPAKDAALITQVTVALRRAGFAEVRSAGRAAPPAISMLPPGSIAPVHVAPPSVTAAPPPAAAPSVSPPRSPVVTTQPPVAVAKPVAKGPPAQPVVLSTVGLHVGGPLNDEPHRSRLVKTIEKQFAAFKRCHARATKHEQGASYGVDLLVPKEGGKPKIKEQRTRLEGKGFAACMNDAFQAIRFAPPPTKRDEIVSYSVLFKPTVR
jgi:hypothetical protein